MDWSKAKGILIVVFLMLNIFLFANIISYNTGQNTSKSILKSTVTILNNNGVSLKCVIPNKSDNFRMILYEPLIFNKKNIAYNLLGAGYDEVGDTIRRGTKNITFLEKDNSLEYINEKPDENVDIKVRKQVEQLAEGLLKKLELKVSDYYLDSYIDNQNSNVQIKYIGKFKGYPLFSNYIDISISNEGITKVLCKIKQPTEILNRDSKIIPAYSILLKHYTNGGSKVIEEIELGFMGLNIEQETKRMNEVTVWRIREQDGQDRFFGSIDGVEIK